MNGSVFVVRASSESEARSIIEDDIYTKAGAWNVKKATFMPVSLCIMLPSRAASSAEVYLADISLIIQFKTAIATAVEPPK